MSILLTDFKHAVSPAAVVAVVNTVIVIIFVAPKFSTWDRPNIKLAWKKNHHAYDHTPSL